MTLAPGASNSLRKVDAYAAVLREIAKEAYETPDLVRRAAPGGRRRPERPRALGLA